MILKESSCGKKYYTDNRPEIICHDVYGEDYKKFLNDFIPYLESKPDDEWVEVIFANADTSKRCVIYHFAGFIGQDHPGMSFSTNMDWYEHFICPVSVAGCQINDKKSDKYPQETAKARSIAYLKNLLSGVEIPPFQALENWFNERSNDKAVA